MRLMFYSASKSMSLPKDFSSESVARIYGFIGGYIEERQRDRAFRSHEVRGSPSGLFWECLIHHSTNNVLFRQRTESSRYLERRGCDEFFADTPARDPGLNEFMKGTELSKLFLVLILAVGAVFVAGCGARGATTANSNANVATAAIVDVTTTQAVVKPIPTYLRQRVISSVTNQPMSRRTSSGKILEVNFDVGSFVQKGSVLVRLDPRDAQIRPGAIRGTA